MVECGNCHKDVKPVTKMSGVRTGVMSAKKYIRDECPECDSVFEETEQITTLENYTNV